MVQAWHGNPESPAANLVLELSNELIDEFDARRPPMPVVVLQAVPDARVVDGPPQSPEQTEDLRREQDEQVAKIVEFVHDAQAPRRLLCRLLNPPDGPDAYDSAITMLRDLSSKPWENHSRSQYRPYAYPRSRLIEAIEQAARDVSTDGAGHSAQVSEEGRKARLLERLTELRWRPGERRYGARMSQAVESAVNPSGFAGAVVLACYSVLLGEAGWQTALIVGLAAFLVFTAVTWAALKAPPLVWLRQASHWFATTTFLASSDTSQAAEWSRWRPLRSWGTVSARACEVAEQLIMAGSAVPGEERDKAQQFHVQLRTLALLEDLRINFRPWSLDLRRRKRTVPPVVFLPRATGRNGGVLLLQAISDVRSRRSEQDPLLLLAAVPQDDRLDQRAAPDREAHQWPTTPDGLYHAWSANLRLGQSPSVPPVLPWILRIPLTPDSIRPHGQNHRQTTKRIRSTPTRLLWSRPTFTCLLALTLAAGFVTDSRLARHYCEGRLPGSNHDSVRVADHTGHLECIGVATGGVTFSEGADAVALQGAGSKFTLPKLEAAISKENADVVERSGSPYVTIVYAGPLTASPGNDLRRLKGLEELAGVYTLQMETNHPHAAPVKLRVLLANGGEDMFAQREMVKRIEGLAQRDKSIVGVVGMGRDTVDSDEAIGELESAGLPLVDTTNSGTDLATKHANYFGLAATDKEEGDALGLIATQLASRGPSKQAVVIVRKTDDKYTSEQAKYGGMALKGAGFKLPLANQSYALTKAGNPDFSESISNICGSSSVPDAVYFAGRVDDIGALMWGFNAATGCSGRKITIFTGDDLTKNTFSHGETPIAPNVTLYFVALTALDKTRTADFFHSANVYLLSLAGGLKDFPYTDPLFVDGQVALAHDAAAALYEGATLHSAASSAGRPRNAAQTWANMRAVDVQSLATGRISFAGSLPYTEQTGHGMEIVRVRHGVSKANYYLICGRAAGDIAPLTQAACALPSDPPQK
jgi:hypothetical protein